MERVYQRVPAAELLAEALTTRLRAAHLPLTRTRFHALCPTLMRMGFSSDDIIKTVHARPELTSVEGKLNN